MHDQCWYHWCGARCNWALAAAPPAEPRPSRPSLQVQRVHVPWAVLVFHGSRAMPAAREKTVRWGSGGRRGCRRPASSVTSDKVSLG